MGVFYLIYRYATPRPRFSWVVFSFLSERLIFYLYNGDIYRYHTRVKIARAFSFIAEINENLNGNPKIILIMGFQALTIAL